MIISKLARIHGERKPNFRFIRSWIFMLAAGCLAQDAQANSHHVRNISDFSGTSIVEQIQAAIKDCGSASCEVFIPPGKYQVSGISNWTQLDVDGSRVGVAIPSNVELRGSGPAKTVIEVTRYANDPPATLFENANPSGRNIRIHDMSIRWTDSATTYNWVSIFICRQCVGVELDHLELEGNPNKLVNLLDSHSVDVHDNTFVLHSTGYGHGDNALSLSRFDASAPRIAQAGTVHDNRFLQNGDYGTFSMLIVAQSGLKIYSDVFESPFDPKRGPATGIEMGQDGLGELPDNVIISDNILRGASIAHGGMNQSKISGNSLTNGDIYIALQSGTKVSMSGLTIAGNELHFGSIGLAGLEGTTTSRCILTRNRISEGNIRVGNSPQVSGIEVSYNTVRYTGGENGIDCNACSVIKGNIVRNIGQKWAGDLHAGYFIAGAVEDVSDNVYLDDQHEYNNGTICSVAASSSDECLRSGGSRWVLLRGGKWGAEWTNRNLFSASGIFLIRAFSRQAVLELESNAFFNEGTHYQLHETTQNAFALGATVIERFVNNSAISTEAPFRGAAVQEGGTVEIRNASGNTFTPYSCSGKCASDYRRNANPAQ